MTVSTVTVSDAIGLADLIEKTVKERAQTIQSAIDLNKSDLDACHSEVVDIQFGPSIQLQLSVGIHHYDLARIEARKIEGFWSDRVVSASLNVDRFSREPSVKASVGSSAGGEELEGITSAQAYVNKGRAIKLVAEALVILEMSPTMCQSLMDLDRAQANLKDLLTKRQQEAARAKRAEFQASLASNSDLIRIEDPEAVIAVMKDIALNNEHGQKALLAFHDGSPTEREGEEALRAVAFFNTSTNKRQMTAQYLGKYPAMSTLTHEPGNTSRGLEKLTLKDLSATLSGPSPIFVSRSLSDPKLIESLR